MTPSIYTLNKNISIREMLDLYSSGNIFMQGETQVDKIKAILLNRILDDDIEQGEVHLRFRKQQNVENEIESLERLVQTGVRVVVWIDQSALSFIDNRFNIVIVNSDHTIAKESFIIASYNHVGRTLIAWEGDDMKENNTTKGVLVTDPEATTTVIAKIHSALEA